MRPPRQTASDGMNPPRPADTPPMEGKVFWKVLLVLCHPCGIEYYVFVFGSIIVRKCIHPVRLRLSPLNEEKVFRKVLLVLCHPCGIP